MYYNYVLSDNGKAEPHGDIYEHDYLVDLLANRSSDFLKASWQADPSANVLAMVGTPAAHNPCEG